MDAGCDQKAKSETFGKSNGTALSDMFAELGSSSIRVEAGCETVGTAAVIGAIACVEDGYVHGAFPFLEVVFQVMDITSVDIEVKSCSGMVR